MQWVFLYDENSNSEDTKLQLNPFSKNDETSKILVNSIANIAFITKVVNNDLKDNLPETYLEKVKEERRESIFINGKPSLWNLDNFKIRIQSRKKNILRKFNEYLNED